MEALSRIFITVFLMVAAVWTSVSWGGDPHLDQAPASFEDFEFESENFDDDAPTATGAAATLEVPSKPQAPAVPPLFGAASETFKEWSHPTLPAITPTKPARQISSAAPSETQKWADEATAKEAAFQEQVMEASLGPDPTTTYRKILSVISGGKVQPRPVQDDR